jgi:hypothetical protein
MPAIVVDAFCEIDMSSERAAVINRISQGIRSNAITGADILSLASASAAKKRQQRKELSTVR